MQSGSDSIATYIRAKDGNLPHLMRSAFAEDATLETVVNSTAISFPPITKGVVSITDVLVTRFGETFEYVHTFCLGEPPTPVDAVFSCAWLVGMSERQSGTVRVGCGRYDWSFQSGGRRLVNRLKITVEHMQVLPAGQFTVVMNWLSELPYPWCAVREAKRAAPQLDGLAPIVTYLGR